MAVRDVSGNPLRSRNGAVMPLSGVEKSPLVSKPALALLEPGSGGPKVFAVAP